LTPGVHAVEQLVGKLAGVMGPEAKLKIIGAEIVEVFQGRIGQADQREMAGARYDLPKRDRIGRQGQDGPDE
jgi:GMP synthase PP-ATPase subunit